MLTVKLVTWWRFSFEFAQEWYAAYAVRARITPSWALASLEIQFWRWAAGVVIDLSRKRGGDS